MLEWLRIMLAVAIGSVEDLREKLEVRGLDIVSDEWRKIAIQCMDI
jgi:hypothetical protein